MNREKLPKDAPIREQFLKILRRNLGKIDTLDALMSAVESHLPRYAVGDEVWISNLNWRTKKYEIVRGFIGEIILAKTYTYAITIDVNPYTVYINKAFESEIYPSREAAEKARADG